MSSGTKNVWWLVAALLLVVAVMFSARDQGLPEGAQGSYLGRDVKQAQAVPTPARDALAGRANSVSRY